MRWTCRFTLFVVSSLTHTWDWLDKRNIVRRAAFVWMLYMTERVILWTLTFSESSPRAGMEVAAILAAVWAPMTALIGAVFKFYQESADANSSRPT